MLRTQIRATRVGTRARDFSPRSVLHRAVSREKLGREISLADTGIGAWKRILPVAKRAIPNARSVIESGVGVQYGAAFRAEERVVGKDRKLGGLHQRRAHDAERDYQSRGFGFGCWP